MNSMMPDSRRPVRSNHGSMRFLIHWQDFPGYAASCVAAFRRRISDRTLVLYDRENPNTPYRRGAAEGVGEVVDITGWSRSKVRDTVRGFAPDAALVCGWLPYARVTAAAARSSGAPVAAICDNIDEGTLKQRLLPLYRKAVLNRLHDAWWVPGRRAARFLERRGFPRRRIYEGVYCVDTSGLGSAFSVRTGEIPGWPRVFLFVGQYIERKGVRDLLRAFRRLPCEAGWNLWFCGTGPLQEEIGRARERDSRIRDLGFVDPGRLPSVLARAGALVLPALHDNWPLVILEAAAAGLPIVCSNACGSSDELVEEGVNGFLSRAGDESGLAESMTRIIEKTDEELRRMGERSLELAAKYDAERWGDAALRMFRELKGPDVRG